MLGLNGKRLRGVFEVRNKIIHGLDINLDAGRRRRNIRGRAPMVRDAEELLRMGDGIVAAVEAKLRAG